MRVLRCALLGALWFPARALPAQSPDWTAVLAVRPNPTPYLADWQSDPTIVTLVLSYTGGAPVAFHLSGSIRRGGATVVSGRSIAFEFARPSQLLLSTRDGIWETGSVTYQSSLRDQLERTGRIPEGEYQFCVDVRRGLPETGGEGTLATVCDGFTIVAPDPPSLLAPADRDTVRAPYPTFVWTPVIAAPGVRVSYHVRVAEVLPGQSLIEAINNVPQFEDDRAMTSFAYPPEALPLRDSARYVWQVQALDHAGEPLGERRGKSEVWSFVYRPAVGMGAIAQQVAAADSADSTRAERVVSTFLWAGVEIKVLSLADSSFDHYAGRARAKLIPGVFEPTFRFRGVRLTADGRRVRWAPTHLLKVPTAGSVYDWHHLLGRVVPVFVQLDGVQLVADSATGEQHVGLHGAAVVKLPLGSAEDSAISAEMTQDSIAVAQRAAEDSAERASIDSAYAAWEEGNSGLWADFHACEAATDSVWQATGDTQQLWAQKRVCEEIIDSMPDFTGVLPGTGTDSTKEGDDEPSYLDSLQRNWNLLERHNLYFRFSNLHVGPSGPGGTLTLARTWRSQNIGLSGFTMKLYAGLTSLTIADGRGTLDLKGDFTIPPSSGLRPDTTAPGWEAPKEDAWSARADRAVVLRIQQARVSTTGGIYIAASGIPRALIGGTGIAMQTGGAWIDLSDDLSPPDRPASWRGVYVDSARVFLPRQWHTTGLDPATRGDTGQVSIAGRGLTVDESGFSGDVSGSRLEKLGPVGFAGFEGRLDSLRFKFTSGTLDTGYVEGALTVPHLASEIAYHVGFTPTGVGSAYAALTDTVPVRLPALHATARIQRGEFTYERAVGTFAFDARVDVEHEGVSLRNAQLYGLTIASDGEIRLGKGWLVFDTENEASFKRFPVDLDSIGFGSAKSGTEVWLGVAGRFRLNENLPSSAGVFRLVAARDEPGRAWRFARLEVDKLDMQFKNAAVEFAGKLEYAQNDSVYGDGFRSAVRLKVKDQFDVDGTFRVGATASAGMASFRYWYVDAKLALPPPGIQLGTLPLSLYGFGGGAFSRMRAQLDTVTLAATYVPDPTNLFGLKALVVMGSAASAGAVWNADVTLEAAAAQSGGLSSLTLRGDNWLLTPVSQREKKLWGTVHIDLPVSRPVFHAQMNLNVDIKPALKGKGWAALHYDPNEWYVHVGTRSRPDSLTMLPGKLDLESAAYFMMDQAGIDAGFATFLEKEKRSGIFYGRVEAGFEAEAFMRYRPFMAAGEGELWGKIVAKVKGYELMSGNARASMNFRFPEPTRIWGKVRVRYRLLSGTLRGTYRMRYSWGSGSDDELDGPEQFVLVASTDPVKGDTAAAQTGVAYYLGMSEGAEYGVESGETYRLRLASPPVLQVSTAPPSVSAPAGAPVQAAQAVQAVAAGVGGAAGAGAAGSSTSGTPGVAKPGARVPAAGLAAGLASWRSLGTASYDFDTERTTLLVKAPGAAPLAPGTRYRSIARFVLERRGGSSAWSAESTFSDTVVFATHGTPAPLSQFISAVSPAGSASPLYYGGPGRGAVRVAFSNALPQITSGAVRGQLAAVTASGPLQVAGSWRSSAVSGTYYAAGAAADAGMGPQTYVYAPNGGTLAPDTRYRFTLATADTAQRELYALSFATSRYASLAEHVRASETSVVARRGRGPLTGAGRYLLGARITLAAAEPIVWNDILDIDVVGTGGAAATVSPRSGCRWTAAAAAGSLSSAAVQGTAAASAAPRSREGMCGKSPTYESTLDIELAADADSLLPPADARSITVRLNHRREGPQSFTFEIPEEGPPRGADVRAPLPPAGAPTPPPAPGPATPRPPVKP